MANMPALVRSITERTGLPQAAVAERASALQDSENVTPKHLAEMLLALSSDEIGLAADFVRLLGAFETPRLEIPRALLWSDLPQPPKCPTAGQALAGWIDAIWCGNRAARRDLLEIDVVEPAIHLRSRDGARRSFFPPGTFIAPRYIDSVRRPLLVPGIVIAAIGADLGQRACADAA